MLGLIAAVLIVLWLLGFLDFHGQRRFIHPLAYRWHSAARFAFLSGSSRTA